MQILFISLLAVSFSSGLSLAAPVYSDPIIVYDKDHVVDLGERPAYRVTTVVMCIVYTFLLAFAQGKSTFASSTKWCLTVLI